MPGRVILTAPWGGHAAYAYAIGYHLRRLGVEPVFLAPRRYSWIWERLSELGPVRDLPVPRGPGEPLLRGLHRWPLAAARALRLVAGAEALVSTGANPSIPPALAARLRGARVYSIVETDRILEPSRTARLLYRLRVAHVTLLAWEEQRRHYPRGLVVGPFYEPRLVEPRSGGYVFVTAGTLGNKRLFDAVVRLPIKHAVVQTGAVDPEPYRRLRPDWVFLRYTSRFHELLAGADAVIAQFPAMTPATARLAYGKPTVMVAAPHLRLSSSLENAPLFAEKIGAVYLEEPDPEALMEALRKARRLPVPRHREGAREAARLIAEEADP